MSQAKEPVNLLKVTTPTWIAASSARGDAMRSRFVLMPDQSLGYERSRLVYRVVGAVSFFVIGAVVATEFYTQIAAERRFELSTAWDSGRVASQTSAPEAIPVRPGAPRDIVDYMGGPIPQITFPPTQPPTAAKETQATADKDRSASVVAAEKPRPTQNKSGYKKGASHRSNGNTQGPYWEQPSYWAAARGWNSWDSYQGGSDFGLRRGRGIQADRRGQFVMWR
jgi:hypothetical protein